MSKLPKKIKKTKVEPNRIDLDKTEQVETNHNVEELHDKKENVETNLGPNKTHLDENIYETSPRNQIISSLICNIGMFCMGSTLGWSSPVIGQLEKIQFFSSIDITWNGSLIPIGCLVSLPVFGFISANYGRKAGGYFCGLMFLIGILLMAFGPTSIWVLLGRFVCGLGSGSATALPTLYVGETVETKYRGILGSLLVVVEGFGILFSYSVGMCLETRSNLSFIILPFPIIFLVCFAYIPETPMQELRNGNELAALKSLAWLRSLPLNSKQLIDELNHAAGQLNLKLPLPPLPPKKPFFKRIFSKFTDDQTNIPREKPSNNAWKLLFSTRSGRQGLHITIALITAQTFTGLFAILTYANYIFEDAGTALSPDLSSLISGLFYAAGAVFGCIFMDKFGRRVLQISSSLIIAVCYAALSISLQLINRDNKTGFLTIIPLIALPVSIFSNNMGLTVIPFVIMTEIFDLEVKDLATTITMLYVWISMIILMMIFPYLVATMNLINTFYIFAAVALFSAIHSYYFLIETKGKSLDEILAELSKEKKNDEAKDYKISKHQ